MMLAPDFGADREPDDQHHQETEHRARDQRHVRRLALAVRHRQDAREVACPRERVDLPAEGEDDGVERGDQTDHRDRRQDLRDIRAEQGAEPVEERLAGLAEAGGTRRDARVQEEHEERGDDERQDAGDDALGHVGLRIVRFLRRERQLLDGEEQPHREGQRGEDAAES